MSPEQKQKIQTSVPVFTSKDEIVRITPHSPTLSRRISSNDATLERKFDAIRLQNDEFLQSAKSLIQWIFVLPKIIQIGEDCREGWFEHLKSKRDIYLPLGQGEHKSVKQGMLDELHQEGAINNDEYDNAMAILLESQIVTSYRGPVAKGTED